MSVGEALPPPTGQPHIDTSRGQPPRAEGAPTPVAARRRGEVDARRGVDSPTLNKKLREAARICVRSPPVPHTVLGILVPKKRSCSLRGPVTARGRPGGLLAAGRQPYGYTCALAMARPSMVPCSANAHSWPDQGIIYDGPGRGRCTCVSVVLFSDVKADWQQQHNRLPSSQESRRANPISCMTTRCSSLRTAVSSVL